MFEGLPIDSLHPVYMSGIYALAAFFGYSCYVNYREPSTKWTVAYFVSALALLLISRLPAMLLNVNYVDEAQILATSYALGKGSYFLHIDSTTHGPLSSLPLYLLSIKSMFGARLMAALLSYITFLLSWYFLAELVGREPAFTAGGVLIWLHSFQSAYLVYVHYTSHHIPLLIISMALLILVLTMNARLAPKWGGPLLAMCLGALPFAKLQTVPLALILAVFSLIWFLRHSELEKVEKIKIGALSVLSSAVVPALYLVPVIVQGQFHDFYLRYIKSNLAHASSSRQATFDPQSGLHIEFKKFSMLEKLQKSSEILTFPGAKPLLLGTLLLTVGTLIWYRLSKKSANTEPLLEPSKAILVAIVVMGAFWGVISSGSFFQHYLLQLALPVVLVLAVALKAVRSDPKAISPVFCFLFGLVMLPLALWGFPTKLRPMLSFSTLTPQQQHDFIGLDYLAHLNERVKPGDKLAVWGYFPMAWVRTLTVPAGKDITCERLLEDRFDTAYYRKEYLEEFTQDPPKVFFDSVAEMGNSECPLYARPQRWGHENFPELSSFIKENYELVPMDPKWGRIFVRK